MTLEDLNQHLALREKLNKAEEMLDALRLAAEPGAAKLTGMPHAPGVKDKVGDLAIEIADLSARVDCLRRELAQQETEVEAFVSQIEDDTTRMYFRLRFLRGLTWGEVASFFGRYVTEKSVSDKCYKYMKAAELDGTERNDAE